MRRTSKLKKYIFNFVILRHGNSNTDKYDYKNYTFIHIDLKLNFLRNIVLSENLINNRVRRLNNFSCPTPKVSFSELF